MMKIIEWFEKKLRNRLAEPLNKKFDQQDRWLEQQESMMLSLANANFRTHAMLKTAQGLPINVLLACHSPTLWNMFESVYMKMANSHDFQLKVVALPYKHSTFPVGEYKDDGIYEYLQKKGVDVIRGYDKEKDEWINPESLSPDYVFFQTPYDLFTDEWAVSNVSMYAKICYIPYGMGLFSGDIDRMVHPVSFFKYTKFFFLENKLSAGAFREKFAKEKWFNPGNIVLTGYTKAEFLDNGNSYGNVWRRGLRKDIKRILWTPRWTTSDGTCHFFDYKDYFPDFCLKHQEVDFVFRPHPLCMQNFLTTGELTAATLKDFRDSYEQSHNMALDESREYRDIFLTSDILISDISTMIPEFFVTGKPIIYTHRIYAFNPLGAKLSEGLYWVKSKDELDETLEMLLSGRDPLREKRNELSREIFFVPEGGSGTVISNALLRDFRE